MPISWNEIRTRAITFTHDWADAADENADAQTFWNELFNVFGVDRKRVGTFEKRVKKLAGAKGFIDLLWKGKLLVEHKSRGKDLDAAHAQARDYFPGITNEELPRYIIVCDFARFRIIDIELDKTLEFNLSELPENIQSLGFMAGYETRVFREQDPVNKRAAKKLGELHDALKDVGYKGHKLEVYLVRVLFCLFADDTGIFVPTDIFQDLIEQRTNVDGSDTGQWLQQLFETLNQPVEDRSTILDEQLQQFPYVNGGLFNESLPTASFNSKLRKALIECCKVNWGQISPAIFGSIFQEVMSVEARDEGGAHYTSEKNILKAIKPLFVTDLAAEFERVKTQPAKLRAFHDKLGSLNFFDPACGCGNFLVIAYRELRLLELEVIRKLYSKEKQQLALDVIHNYVKVDVDQFHGIEIEEWPVQVARVAMWLIDHQMNVVVSKEFGDALVRVPLVKTANIVHGDALRTPWESVLPSAKCNFLLGNPPFKGARLMTAAQKASSNVALHGVRGASDLDLVSGWYVKAAAFLTKDAKAALVSTNSITQGVQVGLLWSYLLSKGVKIHFAHRTFKWQNEASGQAAVYCVIIGFANHEPVSRDLYDYLTPTSDPIHRVVKRINPYLIDADDILLKSRSKPISPDVPVMTNGSMANDGGFLLLSPEEREEMLDRAPAAKPYIKPFMQVDEFLEGQKRYALWLVDQVGPASKLAPIRERIAKCKTNREESTRDATKALASLAGLFGEIRQPTTPYLLVPRHTGELRRYIPMGFFGPDIICGDANLMVLDATLYDFGVLGSSMHMAWVSSVCGRLESRYRYSARIVYNNFPWPSKVSAERRNLIAKAAQGVLDARKAHKKETLLDLYDPLGMPKDLVMAHRLLDRVVDAAYGRRKYESDADRVAYLFGLYDEMQGAIATAAAAVSAKKAARKKIAAT